MASPDDDNGDSDGARVPGRPRPSATTTSDSLRRVAPAPEPKLEVAFDDGSCVTGSIGNLFLTITRVHQDQAALRRVHDALGLHYARWPGGAGALSVIEASAFVGIVSSEEREEMTRMARDFHPRGVALVIEGSGFRPAAMRGLLAGVYLVTRSPYPRRIFDGVSEAAAWIAQTASAGHPGSVTAATVSSSIERLRHPR